MLKINESPCLHYTCIDFQYGEIHSCQGVVTVDDENLHSSRHQREVLWDGLCLSAPTFFFSVSIQLLSAHFLSFSPFLFAHTQFSPVQKLSINHPQTFSVSAFVLKYNIKECFFFGGRSDKDAKDLE